MSDDGVKSEDGFFYDNSPRDNTDEATELSYVLSECAPKAVPSGPVPEPQDDAQPQASHREESDRLTLTTTLLNLRTSGDDWTHLVREPETFRSRLTDRKDAQAVYDTTWRYVQDGLSVMERRLSPVTRLSVAFRFTSGVLVARGAAEDQFIAACARALQEAIRDSPGAEPPLPPQALSCFALRGGYPDGHVPEIWLHWPGIAVSKPEFSNSWCAEQLAQVRTSLTSRLGEWTVHARNNETHVPLYGCTVSEDLPPMLLVACVDEAGVVHRDWRSWLLANDCSAAWHVGHRERWPAPAQLGRRLDRLLPLLCSINPMGTLCRSLALPPASEPLAPREDDVVRILAYLGPVRRATVASSNEVGQLLHLLSSGAGWAERRWTTWCVGCTAFADVPAAAVAECGQQWREFASGDGDTDVHGVLYEMVRQDTTAAQFESFLHAQRAADHPNRGGVGGADFEGRGLLGQLGSATHHDLAQFVKHELRSVAVCTSVTGHGVWYVYHRQRHRWAFDPEGADVLVWVLQILSEQVNQLRSAVATSAPGEGGWGGTGAGPAAAAAPPRGAAGAGMRMPFPRLANFPDEVKEERDVARAILVHLDTVIGDVRHMQSVVRYLGKLVCNRGFAEQLDVKHDHLIPFANGVLDLQRLVLRPGVPSDYLMRGPTYTWVDYSESDADTEEMERMLTQIFTDAEVLQFFCEAGASWLRRRNRFKHFYRSSFAMRQMQRMTAARVHRKHQRGKEPPVLTCAPGPVDSLWVATHPVGFRASMLKPSANIQAITGKDSDASAHSDYLARTHGQAVCVCNEPDSSTQVLMADKVKSMTSDTDCLSVRQLYGSTRDMPITWKLVLLCITPPRYSQLDGAALERTQFVPCTSTFVPEGEAPAREEDRYRQSRFVRRDIPAARQKDLARRLMAIFYCTYVRCGMNQTAYHLHPPRRLLVEKDQQLQELSTFRMYLKAFLRPCGCAPDNLISASAHGVAKQACQAIRSAYALWAADPANAKQRNLSWGQLDASARRVDVVGSPGWVRCQSVHLLHYVASKSPSHRELYASDPRKLRNVLLRLRVPYVEAGYVADQFNRYRAGDKMRWASCPPPATAAPRVCPAQSKRTNRHARSGGCGCRAGDGKRKRREGRTVRHAGLAHSPR
jgi:hypothetical protein